MHTQALGELATGHQAFADFHCAFQDPVANLIANLKIERFMQTGIEGQKHDDCNPPGVRCCSARSMLAARHIGTKYYLLLVWSASPIYNHPVLSVKSQVGQFESGQVREQAASGGDPRVPRALAAAAYQELV